MSSLPPALAAQRRQRRVCAFDRLVADIEDAVDIEKDTEGVLMAAVMIEL